MIFLKKYRRKQLLRDLFNRYVLSYPTIRLQDLSTSRHINKNLRNATADAYKAPPRNDDFTNESSYYAPHSIATSSFALRYALTISSPHSITTTSNKTQQPTRTEHLPKPRFPFLRRNSYYKPHSITTASFTPLYALSNPPAHSVSTTSQNAIADTYSPTKHNDDTIFEVVVTLPRPRSAVLLLPFYPFNFPPNFHIC